jgi:septum formation protein
MLQIPFRVDIPDIDETRHPGEAPEGYVVRLARAKAAAVAARAPGEIVLAADTTVTLDGRVFEKPRTPEEAGEFLRQLSGRTHRVMTAVAVAREARLEDALDITAVTFRTLSERTIADYVATGESMDKAGGYATQGMGAALVERIEGDFFGVMGLPLRLALDLLERFGRPYRFTR